MYLFIAFVACGSINMIEAARNKTGKPSIQRLKDSTPCPDPTMCRSKWGYCGTGDAYCGDGCQAGPCKGGGGGGGDDIITDQNFACVFNTIDDGTRADRLNGLKNSGWKPANNDEAAVFLAHVFHETDGLKTLREYCAPGEFSCRKNLIIEYYLGVFGY